ncbi:MAG: MmgE/PrpD family protein [Nitrospinota bacterium]|nr:MmgE/PrpD family protein [Nitrospinota bacterium]
MNISRKFIQHLHGISYDVLPDEVRDRAKYFLLDFLGVSICGTKANSSRAFYDFIRNNGSHDGSCTIIGSTQKTTPSDAALVNGGVSHAIEMDDVTTRSSLHPGVSVMPSSLAVSEAHCRNPKRLIEAIVAGYEVTNRIGNAVNAKSHYARGFHPTATCGTFASSITASKLLGQSFDKMANALAIAGSQASGSMQFLDNGAWTKRFHPGWSAHSGIYAAYMAENGFIGPSDILGGESGFFAAYSDDSNPEYLIENLGNYWEISETGIKPYACCRFNHAAVDATISLCKKHDLFPENIEKVEVRVPKTSELLVINPEDKKRNPKNIVEAQFSLHYAVAVSILKRAAGLAEYSDEFISSRDFDSLIHKIFCFGDEEMDKEFPEKWQANVKVITKNDTYEIHQPYPKGDPKNPLTWDELIERFYLMTSEVVDRKKSDEIVEKVSNLEKLESISEFTELCSFDS